MSVRVLGWSGPRSGKIGVSFDAFSYAGVLGVTVVADPMIVTDPAALTEELAHAFDRLISP